MTDISLANNVLTSVNNVAQQIFEAFLFSDELLEQRRRRRRLGV